MTKFSVVKINDSYSKFSEGVKRRYEGYDINKQQFVVNSKDDVLDLDVLKKLLTSTDLDQYDHIKSQIYGKTSRFLNGEESMNIAYTSFPRSGNSFFRKLLENVTGVATGSDMVMLFMLNVAL